MTAADWERLGASFEELARLPAEDAAARLAAHPDAAERDFLARLLAADAAPWPWLEAPLLSAVPEVALPPGTRLGAWQVTGELGRGGMGVVLASRRADGLYEQEVAIKVLAGRESDLAGRFDLERRILAGLEHPAITRILDAGLGPGGEPYLVMEAVRGRPIDAFCAEQGLDLRARLGLFVRVAEAVAHAHRRLVVHCDLKPSNVLVTEGSAPKLLDFGIARLLAPEASAAGTAARRRLTPAYASPEQRRGETLTTATDIYSLGALLHRLVRGVPPGEAAAGDPVPRDLEAILRRSLAEEPSGRYASVDELVADLGRFAEGRPVVARPASLVYRGLRFVGRHRAGVVLSLLALGAAGAGVVRLDRERARAERERARAEEVAGFLTGLFRGANPAAEEADPDFGSDAAGRAARELLLDEGRERLAESLGTQPDRRVSLLAAIGDAYRHLGRLEKAAPLLEEALALETRPGERSARLLDLCRLRLAEGALEHAEAACREALTLRPAGRDELATAEVENELGLVLRSRRDLPAAEALFARALARRRVHLPPGDRATTASLNNLALVRQERGDPSGAEPLLREVLATRRERLGDTHLLVLQAENNLASVLQDLGRPAESAAAYRQALAAAERGLGDGHPFVATLHNNLGALALAQGQLAEARAAFARAVEIAVRGLGGDHPETAGYRFNLAVAHYQAGDRAAAASEFARTLASRATTLGAGHPEYAATLWSLVRVVRESGQDDVARAHLQAALAAWRETPPADATAVARAESLLADGPR